MKNKIDLNLSREAFSAEVKFKMRCNWYNQANYVKMRGRVQEAVRGGRVKVEESLSVRETKREGKDDPVLITWKNLNSRKEF